MTAISPHVSSVGAPVRPQPVEHHKFVRALSGRIEPVRVGLGYQLGLLLAAITMLLLPLIYVALVGVVVYGLYYHATENASIFSTRGNAKVKVLVYLAPLVVGIILVLFMVKPLFARRGRQSEPTGLSREDEPLLFAFVERLCEVVGAPKPSKIQVDTQVNASASFRSGLLGFLRKDLVLTIGMPLAAGLTIRQLAGVLAHEFGHFAQGTGMRLTFIVRSINNWFARVVYERDAWDEMLENASHDGGHFAITLVLLFSRLFVWLTRRVLWVLMVVGHAVSSFMLRQMEFDADRYETRVAGSNEFARTSERIRHLSVSSQAAFNDLRSAWQEKRLGDDLSLLVCHRDATMPNEVRQALAKHAAEQKTGWFDTHPCDAARVRSSARENCDGLFRLEDPATELFTDFCTLSRDTTVAFYRHELGLSVSGANLVSSSDLISTVARQDEAQRSVGRFFQGLIHPARPVFFAAHDDVRDPGAAAELILKRRGQVMEFAGKLAPAARVFEELDKKLANVRAARAMLSAGVRPNFAELGIPRADYDGLRPIEQQTLAHRDTAVARLNEVLGRQMQRLHVALALESLTAAKAAPPPPPPPSARVSSGSDLVDFDAADDDAGEYAFSDEPPTVGGVAGGAGVSGTVPAFNDPLRRAFAALASAAKQMDDLRHQWTVLAGLLPHLPPDASHAPEPLVNEVLARSRKLTRSLADVRDTLHKVPYPYAHADRGVSLAAFVIKAIPAPEEVGAAYHAAESALDAYYPLYLRILSDLCTRAEAAEQSLGLDPLPEPTEDVAGS